MDLQFDWRQPLDLIDGGIDRLTYTLTDADDQQLLDVPGVYVFGRRHGKSFEPLYIGQALRLRHRIWAQLNNNRLMNSLLEAPSGRRQVVVAEFLARRGQSAPKALELVERGLIKLALAQGHDIVNVHGTRVRSHTVEMVGNRSARAWLPERRVQFE